MRLSLPARLANGCAVCKHCADLKWRGLPGKNYLELENLLARRNGFFVKESGHEGG